MIDKTVCLCLNQRWNERKCDILDMSNRIRNFGSDFQIFMAQSSDYPAIQDKDLPPIDYYDVPKYKLTKEILGWGYGNMNHKHNHWNALQCHKKIIEQAITEQRKNILMLEDDAYFTYRFELILNKIKDIINTDKFPIIYFGWWFGDENDEFNTNIEKAWDEESSIQILKAKVVGGLHAALIDRQLFNFLLNLPDNNPIDAQLNLCQIHDQINSILITPKMIHTRSTYSYCEGNILERKII